MDQKLNYCKFELFKKPHQKRPITREITLFLKVSKMTFFSKIAKRGPNENFQKSPIIWSNLGKLKK